MLSSGFAESNTADGVVIRQYASEDEYEESLAITEILAQAGSSEEGSVNLAAGSYQVICTVVGHFSAGMEGTIEVTS